ncbi:hypothetical protein D3C81_1739090 [compost metagenome]
MMINIAKNYRQYSSEELRSFAYSGLLECNGYDLDSFLEYLFQGMISQDELDKAIEEAKKNCECDCNSDGDEVYLKDQVKRAIKILEDGLE